jgi:hypothetical protein
VLAGHLHRDYSGDVRTHCLPAIRRSILVAQAERPLSQRRRDDTNAYDLITVDPPRLSLVVRRWEGTAFVSATTISLREAGELGAR